MAIRPDAEWPAWAQVEGAVEVRPRPDVARTPFEDGAIRQALRYSAGWTTHRITALIPASRVDEWDAWVASHASAFFRWPRPRDGIRLAARIEGGAGGIRLVQVRRSPGRPVWEAAMTLEGPAAPILAPNLWTVPLGHGSHVYARSAVSYRPYVYPSEVLINLTPWPPPRLDPAFLPAGTAATWINAILVSATGARFDTPNLHFRLSLDERAFTNQQTAGPDLLPAALPGLTHVLQLRPRAPFFISGGTGGSPRDETDPYFWRAPAAERAELRAWINAIRAAGQRDERVDPPAVTGSESLLRWALVWSGAGSVVDLVSAWSRGGGVAPVIASGG